MKIKIGLNKNQSVPVLTTRIDSLIENGTDNPKVPGNGALITALTTENDKLKAAAGELTGLEAAIKEKRAEIRRLRASTLEEAKKLAVFTESATEGEEEGILSAGWDVRLGPSPVQAVAQVQNLKVKLNGKSGVSKLSWDTDPNAVLYVIECSEDPTDATSWKEADKVTESKVELDGAVAGKKCWFRVAAFNKLGQGPWSQEAGRPVL
jgi:hypothetical protein